MVSRGIIQELEEDRIRSTIKTVLHVIELSQPETSDVERIRLVCAKVVDSVKDCSTILVVSQE